MTEQSWDAYGVLKNRGFLQYLSGRFLASMGQQMMTVAIGWELYQRTNAPLALGLVGLMQFLPMFLLTLHAGYVADTRSRRLITVWMEVIILSASLGMAWISWTQAPVLYDYICLIFLGTARAFLAPASTSLLPQIVEREQLSRAVTWNSMGFQFSSVIGPAVSGLLLAFYPPVLIYSLNAIMAGICAVLIWGIHTPAMAPLKEKFSFQSLMVGPKFIFSTRIILATITLDLFAVLLGGATSLFPVYARDILHVGSGGLGLLQGALPLGSGLMAVAMAHLPPFKKAGQTMLWAVVGFGLGTIVFGYSTIFILSWAALFVCGAMDSISVVIRQSLVQILTPDEMRGRVTAINFLFIGTSNELGGFESGFVAQFSSPLFAVVSGGIGTIITVILTALIWPEVRKYGRLGEAVKT